MKDCRHVWLHMKRVDENMTKIICKECNQVMGFFKEEQVREPDFMRKTMRFSISDNCANICSSKRDEFGQGFTGTYVGTI